LKGEEARPDKDLQMPSGTTAGNIGGVALESSAARAQKMFTLNSALIQLADAIRLTPEEYAKIQEDTRKILRRIHGE
jgi:hypothetical protein